MSWSDTLFRLISVSTLFERGELFLNLVVFTGFNVCCCVCGRVIPLQFLGVIIALVIGRNLC